MVFIKLLHLFLNCSRAILNQTGAKNNRTGAIFICTCLNFTGSLLLFVILKNEAISPLFFRFTDRYINSDISDIKNKPFSIDCLFTSSDKTGSIILIKYIMQKDNLLKLHARL